MCCGLRFVLIALLEPVQLCHMNSNGIWVGKGTRATLGVVEDGFALSETASDHWMRGYKYMLRVRHTRAHGPASSPPHPLPRRSFGKRCTCRTKHRWCSPSHGKSTSTPATPFVRSQPSGSER